MAIGLVGGREDLRSVDGSEEDNETDIDDLIGGGVVTDPVREVEEAGHELEEEEVERAFELEEGEEGEIEVLERVGLESGSR